MKFEDGIETALILGVDENGYLHILSRLDTEQSLEILEDAVEVLKDNDEESFTIQ